MDETPQTNIPPRTVHYLLPNGTRMDVTIQQGQWIVTTEEGFDNLMLLLGALKEPTP